MEIKEKLNCIMQATQGNKTLQQAVLFLLEHDLTGSIFDAIYDLCLNSELNIKTLRKNYDYI